MVDVTICHYKCGWEDREITIYVVNTYVDKRFYIMNHVLQMLEKLI